MVTAGGAVAGLAGAGKSAKQGQGSDPGQEGKADTVVANDHPRNPDHPCRPPKDQIATPFRKQESEIHYAFPGVYEGLTKFRPEFL